MAKLCLQKLYKPGIRYHKTGIMLLDLDSHSITQFDLFLETDRIKSDLIMKTVDTINERMGKYVVFHCAEGTDRAWKVKCDKRSPRYTTHWNELVGVK
jgi:DNA polymerase V